MVDKANSIPDRAINRDEEGGPEDDDDLLRRVRLRFMIHETFWSRIHAVALEDDMFIAGEQWPVKIKEERTDQGRPMLTYNLLPAYNRQIVNKVRQERPQIKVVPVESGTGQSPTVSNVQGTKDYALADVYGGIIKNIEHQSRADHAYDTALKHAVDHGFGWFYLTNQWSRWNPFVQDLKIRRVKNSYSVYTDPGARKADFSDMQDAFMFTRMPRSTFEEKYPDAVASDWSTTSAFGETYEGWMTGDEVRIAQYWWIEYKDDEVVMLSNGVTAYVSEIESVLDDMERDEGIYVVSDGSGKKMRKATKRPVCQWMKMTGTDILDRAELPFSRVPIYPVLGEEIIVDGDTRYESAIRHAKDPQRSYNYWRTNAAETVALMPRAPYMLTAAQVEGHEDMYENANVDNQPYLLYNHKQGVPPPQRNSLKNVPVAELAMATQDAADMQTIIGLHEASLGKDGQEKSGKAIIARQQQGSTSTYQFPDNLNRAIEAMGRDLVEVIPRIYDTRRVLRVRMNDDTEDFVEINQTKRDKESGEEVIVHDLAYGRFDCIIETGKSYATQRQEAADLQLDLLKVLGPEKAQHIVHLIVKNLGVPGSEEVATVLRKLLPDELKSEDERAADLPKGVVFNNEGEPVYEETQEPYQKEQTPQEQQAMKELEVRGQEADAKSQTAQATTKKAEATIAQAQADMAEAQRPPDTDGEQGQQFDQGAMMGDIEGIIKQAFADHDANPNAHGDVIADAIIDALRRTRKFVDDKIKSNEIPALSDQQPAGQ